MTFVDRKLMRKLEAMRKQHEHLADTMRGIPNDIAAQQGVVDGLELAISTITDFELEKTDKGSRWWRTKHVEQVAPEDIKVGDKVIIVAEVDRVAPPVGGSGDYNHIHVKMSRDDNDCSWQGEFYPLWTWGWSGKEKSSIIRLKNKGK